MLVNTYYNKTNPFPAGLKERSILNGPNSTKKTYHLTLDLKDSGIFYEPGDAIAVFPHNPPSHVERLLQLLKRTGNEMVIDPKTELQTTLKNFLLTKVNLSRPTPPLIKKFPDLLFLFENDQKEERKAFVENHDLLDLFEKYTIALTPLQELISYFAPLLPRFYSIASAQCVAKNTLDLLIVTFSYRQGEKVRQGTGSQFLCEHADINQTPISMYHHPNNTFKLPLDPTVPILMIGPGTGVAPYRAFLQERLHQSASGENWLFFGERNRASDFYYEDFFVALERQGKLRLDVAFSRDQEEKVYVQHKLEENAPEIWKWMKGNAIFYICGDAHSMAKDVTATLQKIAMEHGGLSDEQGKDFLKNLRKTQRLLLDVY